MDGAVAKKLKIVASVIVVVVVALGVGIIATLNAIDLNTYRDTIAAEIEAATGRKLTIGGEFSLAIGWKPSIVVEGVALANAEGGSRADMATVERLEATVDLLPMLSGDIVIERLVVIGADVLLETDRNGRGNWTFKDQPAAERSKDAPALPALHDIHFERSLLVYRDGKKHHALKIDRLSGRKSGRGKPLSVEFSGAVDQLPLTIVGDIGPLLSLKNNEPFLLDLKLSAAGNDLTVKGAVTKPVDATGIDLKAALSVSSKVLAKASTRP